MSNVPETGTYQVVDLFAGPGGLGEGFNAFRRRSRPTKAFETIVSVEKDAAAHRTLRFRAFYRRTRASRLRLEWEGFDPADRAAEIKFLARQSSQRVAVHWEEARREALCAELGGDRDSVEMIEESLRRVGRDSILIGGPPCQAYSLVGRARNRGIAGYRAEDDGRHFLYKEYVRILRRTQPAIFVMENVKGILSARVRREGVFERILEDLEDAGYRMLPLAPDMGRSTGPGDPYDYVIRAEDYGVPQARHRVIVFGVRDDVVARLKSLGIDVGGEAVRLFGRKAAPGPLRELLSDLPRLPSTLSRRGSKEASWIEALAAQGETVNNSSIEEILSPDRTKRLKALVSEAIREARREAWGEPDDAGRVSALSPKLRRWLGTRPPFGLLNHVPRGHMPSDLGRYLYAACFAEVVGRSPKAEDFPSELAPNHANWRSGKFSDRFRVQKWDGPATTVTSHISKDGHYFIHPDPAQCRSLTVREAARIQTFPDDYVFLGNRTEQYVQVGNAVPPYLARRIAEVACGLLDHIGGTDQP